jgi:tetratricopeptide (TPR) repeat protein
MPSLDPAARSQLNQRLATALLQGRFRDALQEAETVLADDDSPPDVAKATSMEYLGRLRRELGHYTQAEPPLLQALSLFGSQTGKESPEYARCLHQLALLYEELAQYSQAEPLYRSALSIRQKALGPDHPDVAESLHDLAGFHDQVGRFAEAAELYRQAREIRRQHLGVHHPDYAASLSAEAWHECRRGNLRQGESLARQAFGIVQETRGPVHPQLASGAQLLSRIALQQARISEAEQFALRVNEVRREVLGERHHRYAGGLENLAFVRAMQGRGEEAERLARQGIEITRDALGDRHPFYAEGLTAIGYALQAQHNYGEAEKCYRQALEVYRAVHGEKHAFVGSCHRDLAEMFTLRESNHQAEEHFRQALAILEPQIQHSPLDYLEVLDGLARSLTAQGRLDDAQQATTKAVAMARQIQEHPALLAGALESQARVAQSSGSLNQAAQLWHEALQTRTNVSGPDHPLCAEALRNLAIVQQMQGDHAAALTSLRSAHDLLRRGLGEKHPDTLTTLASLADAHAQAGEWPAAEELLIQAADSERERVGEQHPDYARVVQQLGRLYQMMNNLPAAEVRYREVLQIMRRTHGEEHAEYARAVQDLAQLYHQVNDFATAAQFYQLASEIRQTNPGSDHPDYAESQLGLAQVLQNMGRLEEAEPLFRQAVQVYRAALGENAMPTLRARHSFALFLQARGQMGAALQELEQAAERLEEVVGPRSPMLTQLLGDQARMLGGIGDHLQAEQLFARIETIHREAFPQDITLQAQDLVNQAIAARALGDFAAAENGLLQALRLLQQHRPNDHPDLLTVAGMLATTLAQQERLEEADGLFSHVVDRTRAVLGQMHPAVGPLLIERAGLAMNRGQLAEALALYREAADVVRGGQGEDNGDYVNLLRMQATVLHLLGESDQAEALLKQRVAILRRLFGPSSSIVAPAQQALADFLRQRQRYDDAIPLARQAYETLRRASRSPDPSEDDQDLGGPSPIVPPPLAAPMAAAGLAALLAAQQQWSTAEPLFRQAITEATEAVGEDHPATANVQYNLALALIQSGREAEALTLLEQLLRRDAQLWPRLLCMVPDQTRAMACQSLHEHYEAYLSLCTQQRVGETLASDLRSGELVQRLLGLTFRRKRMGTEVLAAPWWPHWGERHTSYREELRRLAFLERQLANGFWNGPGAEGQEHHETVMDRWGQERDRLENHLVEILPELALRRRLWLVTPEAVRERLPADFALVEIVHFRETDFSLSFTRESHERTQGRYLAFVLKREGGPWMLDLGLASDLEPRIQAWEAELRAGKSTPEAAGLRAAVVDRLAPLLTDCKGLYLAADGEFLSVPLDALPFEDGLLLDRFVVRNLLCGRDLLRQGRAPRPPSEGRAVPSLPEPGFLAEMWRLFFGSAAVERQVKPFSVQRVHSRDDIALPSPEIVHVAAPAVFRGGEFKPGPWVNPLTQAVLPLAREEWHARHVTSMDLWSTRSVLLGGLDVPPGGPGVWPRLAGLLASFVLAGTAAVTYRLWEPPSAAQTSFQATYYQQLAQGQTASEAFRQARQEVRRRWPSPRDWAGWICLGDMA